MSFPFLLATPERTLFDGDVDTVIVRTDGGEIAFLTGHVGYLGAVVPSECKIEATDGTVRRLAVHGGFVEMGDRCAILAPAAEFAEEIDVTRAQRAQEEAMAAAETVNGDEDLDAALQRARIRLAVAGEA